MTSKKSTAHQRAQVHLKSFFDSLVSEAAKDIDLALLRHEEASVALQEAANIENEAYIYLQECQERLIAVKFQSNQLAVSI